MDWAKWWWVIVAGVPVLGLVGWLVFRRKPSTVVIPERTEEKRDQERDRIAAHRDEANDAGKGKVEGFTNSVDDKFLILVLAAAVLLHGCPGPQVLPDAGPVPKPALEAGWTSLEALRDECHLAPEAGLDGQAVVVCPRGTFKVGIKEAARVWGVADNCLNDLAAARQLGALDVESVQALLARCHQKLESPWRSPWLWGVVGIAVGFGVGVGLGAGAL